METKDRIAERLREARMAAGYATAAEAAHALQVSYPTYAGHENGNRGMDYDALQTYARRFRISLDWLILGKGPANTGIHPDVLRMVIAHVATEYPDVISADPKQVAEVVVDLCEYAQATKKQTIERPESFLAIRRLETNDA